VWHRQTARQLAEEYQKSESWIRQQLDNFSVKKPVIQSQPVVIVADMTFVKRTFGELHWQLWTRGFELQVAVIDGRPGLIEVFWDIVPLSSDANYNSVFDHQTKINCWANIETPCALYSEKQRR